MHDLKLSKKPVNVLRKQILDFSHPNQYVMRLVTFLTNMIAYNPGDRVDILEAMTVISDVYQKGRSILYHHLYTSPAYLNM